MSDRSIRRYTAYFRGWATAFGPHEKQIDEAQGLTWLLGTDQLGLILTPQIKHRLYALFLGPHRTESPQIQLSEQQLQIGELRLPIESENAALYQRLLYLLQSPEDLHLFQTYHLIYPSGTRLLTLSRRAPLPLVYREIAPLRVRYAS